MVLGGRKCISREFRKSVKKLIFFENIWSALRLYCGLFNNGELKSSLKQPRGDPSRPPPKKKRFLQFLRFQVVVRLQFFSENFQRCLHLCQKSSHFIHWEYNTYSQEQVKYHTDIGECEKITWMTITCPQSESWTYYFLIKHTWIHRYLEVYSL